MREQNYTFTSYLYTVQTAYNKSHGSQDEPHYNRNNVVTKCAILMTKARSELTNKDLDIISNRGADKMNLRKVCLHT